MVKLLYWPEKQRVWLTDERQFIELPQTRRCVVTTDFDFSVLRYLGVKRLNFDLLGGEIRDVIVQEIHEEPITA